MGISFVPRTLAIALFVLFTGSALITVAPADAANQLREGALGNESQFGNFLGKFGVTEDKPPQEPGTIISRIVAIVFSFLGIIAVIVIIYAGFLWLTAGGEEDKAKQGRTLLFQAFVGLIIILAAYSVTYFILYQLTLSISP